MKSAIGERMLSTAATTGRAGRSGEIRNCGRKSLSGSEVSGMMCPVHAVHPIKGGRAPTTAPTHVLNTVVRFMYVYTPAYNTIFATPMTAVRGLTHVQSNAGPAMPVMTPNPNACSGVIVCLTNGRFLVRAI